MQNEIIAYIARMQSMLDASLDQLEFDTVCEQLEDQNFTLLENAALFDRETTLPLAWILKAQKQL